MSTKATARNNSSHKKRLSTPQNQDVSAGGRLLFLGRATARGLLASLITLFVLCTAGAAAAFATADPDAYLLPVALGVMLLSALTGGLFAYRSYRRAPLLCGLLCGGCLLLATAFLGLFLPDSLSGGWQTPVQWGLRGGTLAFSALGALIASYTPKRRRRKRK